MPKTLRKCYEDNYFKARLYDNMTTMTIDVPIKIVNGHTSKLFVIARFTFI